MEKKTNMYIFLSMPLLQISSNSHPNQSTCTHTFVCVYIYIYKERGLKHADLGDILHFCELESHAKAPEKNRDQRASGRELRELEVSRPRLDRARELLECIGHHREWCPLLLHRRRLPSQLLVLLRWGHFSVMVRVLTISEGSRLHLYMYIQSSMVLEGLVWRKLKRRRNGEMEGFGGFGIWFLMRGEK